MSFINPFAIGFVAVAAGAFVATDYVTQAQKTGVAPGDYALSDYAASYGIRYDDQVASITKTSRQAVEAWMHLPEAPEGWVRQKWDISQIDMDALTKDLSIVGWMDFNEERGKSMRAAKTDIWEYRRGEEWVRIYARFDPEAEAQETAVSGWMTGTFHPIENRKYAPYDVIQGVPFLLVGDADTLHLETSEDDTFALLEADMGPHLKIAVAAFAMPDSIDDLLAGIDIESLNQMLDWPLDNVGKNAPDLTKEQRYAFAAMHALVWNSGRDPGSLSEKDIRGIVEQGISELPPEDQAAAQTGQVTVASSAQPTTSEKAKPGRLKLSGGRSCVEGRRLCD